MRFLAYLLVAAWCSSTSSTIVAEEPVFDAIDYASPSRYTVIAESLGDGEAIITQAKALKGSDDRRTLANILRWMGARLSYDPDQAYQWRNFDTIVSAQCYGGCADQAIACGALLQGAGIPTVWIKTMDVDWIWDFKMKRPFQTWSGHVFLEIYLDGRWVLLDPGAAKVYVDYSTKSRILPGNRFAYHKGIDPKQMIMSLQWEDWKVQTADYFDDLDESLLPVDTKSARDVQQPCFIVANSPYYQLFGAAITKRGFRVAHSFNSGYEKFLPMAKGGLLLIQTQNGIPIVDVATLQHYFPAVPSGKQSGYISDNDTTIVFIDVETTIADSVESAINQQLPKPAS